MKNIAVIGLSALLAACATGNYTTDVKTESHREEFSVAAVEQPVISESGIAEGISEENVQQNIAETSVQDNEKKVVKLSPKAKPTVSIAPPTAKQVAMNPRYGFTIQVVAVGAQNKVNQFAAKLPQDGQPIWENYKMVNGTKWFTVLYGDYATHQDAAAAITMLPIDLRAMKPFVKSIDAIKNSEYPTLNKLN